MTAIKGTGAPGLRTPPEADFSDDPRRMLVVDQKSPYGQARQGPFVLVELYAIDEYTGKDGSPGARVYFRVSADSDAALSEFFDVRRNRFEEELRREITVFSNGAACLERVEYREGSLTILVFLLQVAAKYPQLKQSALEIASDLKPFLRWVREDLAPSLKKQIEEFFKEYNDIPPVRILKSLFRAIFG